MPGTKRKTKSGEHLKKPRERKLASRETRKENSRGITRVQRDFSIKKAAGNCEGRGGGGRGGEGWNRKMVAGGKGKISKAEEEARRAEGGEHT